MGSHTEWTKDRMMPQKWKGGEGERAGRGEREGERKRGSEKGKEGGEGGRERRLSSAGHYCTRANPRVPRKASAWKACGRLEEKQD